MGVGSTTGMKKSLTLAAPIFLLLVLLFELVSSISLQSVTWDEGDHLFAGYMSLKTRDLSLNPEHPPLAKMVAALPLLPLNLKVVPPLGYYFKDDAYLRGRELIFRNGPANGGRYTADTIMFRARMAVSVFTFALALLVFFAGSEMFSLPAGLLAMTLFVFEPSIITNGAYVTTDETVACMFFAAIFTFYRYVKQPTAARVIVAGIAAGLTLAAKHSGVLLLPMLLFLTAGELILQRRITGKKITLPLMAMAIVVISAIAIFVLWSFYYFRYTMRPDGSAMVPSLATNAAMLKPYQTKGIMFFARFHLLPESYLYGLVDVMYVADLTPSYVLGKVYSHGVWFYFPIVVAIKWTIGAAALLFISIYAAASGRLRRSREVLFLAVPPIVYFAVASSSPLNIGVRHILPIFPFLLVLAAGGAWSLVQQSGQQNRRWAYAVAALLLFHVVSSIRAFPNYLPYANELWGGPSQTSRYLTDSAVDWGQQLKATKSYLDEHHIKDCWFAYTVAPFILPADYGIPCKPLPTLDSFGQMDIDVPQTVNGPILVSDIALTGYEYGTSVRNPYQSLFLRKPDAVISDGVAVFNGSFQLPLASSLEYIHRSGWLLDKDPARALREAQQAIAIAPNNFDPVMAMGDALRANKKNADAATYYGQARDIVKRMEPSAQKDWNAALDQRIASLK